MNDCDHTRRDWWPTLHDGAALLLVVVATHATWNFTASGQLPLLVSLAAPYLVVQGAVRLKRWTDQRERQRLAALYDLPAHGEGSEMA